MRRALEARLDHATHLGELLHQVRLRVQPTGGVDDDDVLAARTRRLRRRRRRPRPGRRRARAADEVSARALGPDLELLLRCRAERVAGAERARCARARRSWCASLPIVVVLPVPLTPTTRITGRLLVRPPSVGRLAEERLDLLRQRVAEVAESPTGLEPPHELRGRRNADVGLDQRLSSRSHASSSAGSNAAATSCSVSARRLLPSESRSRARKPALLRLVDLRRRLVAEQLDQVRLIAGKRYRAEREIAESARRIPVAHDPEGVRCAVAGAARDATSCADSCCSCRGRRRETIWLTAVAAHGHAVEHVGRLHGALLVRDHDELRAVGVAAQQLHEAGDVRVVERRLDLVEEVEGARLREEEREQERDRAERLLAAREQRQPRDPLARRSQLDLDPRLADPPRRPRRAAAGPRRPGRASRRPP